MNSTDLKNWRGVENACDRCDGSGIVAYPDTATWIGGVGGRAITNDVCDRCWGSGDQGKPWLNLRTLRGFIRSLPQEYQDQWASIIRSQNLP